jgi:hypothetical protein
LKKGSTEPVLIASEAQKGIDTLDGQIDDNEQSPTRSAGRNSRLRRALKFATDPILTPRFNYAARTNMSKVDWGYVCCMIANGSDCYEKPLTGHWPIRPLTH